MQVEREGGPASRHRAQQGGEPLRDPVGASLREAESRWLSEVPAGVPPARPEAIFGAAEARWLSALAAWTLDAHDPVGGGRAVEDALRAEERAASTAFAGAAAPTLRDLVRKLALIEREAGDVADHGFCGRSLVVWLAVFRVDLLRLLPAGG